MYPLGVAVIQRPHNSIVSLLRNGEARASRFPVAQTRNWLQGGRIDPRKPHERGVAESTWSYSRQVGHLPVSTTKPGFRRCPGPIDTSIGHWTSARFPYRGLGATLEDEKQPLGDLGLGEIFLGDVVPTFPCGAVDDRNIVRFRTAAKAATEATR